MTASQDQWKVAGRGSTGCVWLDGHSGGFESSVSGIPSKRFEETIDRLEVGGLVMDAEGVDSITGAVQVIEGPMSNLALPPGTVQQGILYPKRKPYVRGMKLGSLDYVSLDVWADLWFALGARIGVKTETGVDWTV